MAKEQTLHAWFSPTCAKENGYAVYKSAASGEVNVTEVCDGPRPFSRWPDLEPVGRVRAFVKTVPSERRTTWGLAGIKL